ncbi:hypothetical protein TRIATDRAFT_322009 [Trichoderma atroviride IMI 206040]|uniref:Uncharacterized protein n=2 Tax=Hypocrea atroviridis TaxID=63577 RepID=G9P8Y3_HYPAI|nr:uncharacterized protein TRIATDRAFT_322009 [Trichoderma atroviride IMI 206040]EHK41855.1 hypothetical protein TRIATDRAFT_322009 [Trichoderma atroviride IMI 206040]
MSRTSVSILALTESCVSKFDNLLASYARGSQRIESLESRLADFNLWADGVGALAKPGASLDSRLQGRLNDLALVKNVLIMLADSLDHCVGLAKNETNYDETAHHEAIQNLDSAIKNLALIGVAIRRTGQASRNRRADKTFNPDNHQELRTHLECIIRLRPTEEALFQQTENGGFVAKLDNSKLSDIQNRLVEANLRRRHKFLIAQKRSRDQRNVQIRPSILEAPSPAGSVLQQEPLADIRNADAAKNKESTSYPITRGHEATAPTISRFSLASTAEGTLRYTPAARKYTPSVTKTQITFIASDVEFPKAPSIPLGREIMKCPCCCQSLPIGTFQNPKLWK